MLFTLKLVMARSKIISGHNFSKPLTEWEIVTEEKPGETRRGLARSLLVEIRLLIPAGAGKEILYSPQSFFPAQRSSFWSIQGSTFPAGTTVTGPT